MIIAMLIQPDLDSVDIDLIDRVVPDAGSPQVDGALRRVFKQHRPDFDLFPRVICNIRDGRDVVVSSYKYYQKALGYEMDFDTFLLSRKAQVFGFWHEHVRTALDFSKLHPDRILFMKFEDLKKDFNGEVKNLAEFLRVPVSAQRISEIKEITGLKRQKVIAEKSDDPRKSSTINRGRTHSYTELLNGRNLEIFEAISFYELQHFGYSLTTASSTTVD